MPGTHIKNCLTARPLQLEFGEVFSLPGLPISMLSSVAAVHARSCGRPCGADWARTKESKASGPMAPAERMCLRLGEFQMRRDKPSSEQSGPTTRYGRQIAYDREIFIAICRRFLLGEDLRTICAKPPMPRSCF